MRQREWHRLVKQYLLDSISDRWPNASLHKPWIVVDDTDHRCYAIGWAVRPWPPAAISNYAKVHLDFYSGTPFAVNDLSLTLGGENGREDWVELGDSPAAEEQAMGVLLSRMLDEAAPFFDSLRSDELIRDRVMARAAEHHPLQKGRLEILAGLALLDNRVDDAVRWYEAALKLRERYRHVPPTDFGRQQHQWFTDCLDAARTDPERGVALLNRRAIEYRTDGKLPTRRENSIDGQPNTGF